MIWAEGIFFSQNLVLVTGIAHLLFRDIFKPQKVLDAAHIYVIVPITLC